MEYKGYKIKRDKDGNYHVTPPNAMRWSDPAANLETAKRWVEQHIAERRNRFAPPIDESRSAVKKWWHIYVNIHGDTRKLGDLEATHSELKEALGDSFVINWEDDVAGEVVVVRKPR